MAVEDNAISEALLCKIRASGRAFAQNGEFRQPQNSPSRSDWQFSLSYGTGILAPKQERLAYLRMVSVTNLLTASELGTQDYSSIWKTCAGLPKGEEVRLGKGSAITG